VRLRVGRQATNRAELVADRRDLRRDLRTPELVTLAGSNVRLLRHPQLQDAASQRRRPAIEIVSRDRNGP
jgi:hypothetical protein